MQRFLREIARGPVGEPLELGLFHDNYCYECNTFNGGFVYQRDTPAGRQCLADWNEESSANNFTKYIKDQVRDGLDKHISKRFPPRPRPVPVQSCSSCLAGSKQPTRPLRVNFNLTSPPLLRGGSPNKAALMTAHSFRNQVYAVDPLQRQLADVTMTQNVPIDNTNCRGRV
eukprot:4822607-Pyramimonas_sp.AAC.1